MSSIYFVRVLVYNSPMVRIHLQDILSWQLLRVAMNAKHELLHIAESYDLTVMQLYTLCLLEADTSIPMNSLSGMLHCDASNVTGIAERLFSHQYIERKENPKDRREKMIALTKKGAKLCEKISEEVALLQPMSLHTLSSAEKKQLQILLTKVIATNDPPGFAQHRAH